MSIRSTGLYHSLSLSLPLSRRLGPTVTMPRLAANPPYILSHTHTHALTHGSLWSSVWAQAHCSVRQHFIYIHTPLSILSVLLIILYSPLLCSTLKEKDTTEQQQEEEEKEVLPSPHHDELWETVPGLFVCLFFKCRYVVVCTISVQQTRKSIKSKEQNH